MVQAALFAIGLCCLVPAAGFAQSAPMAEQGQPQAAWPASSAQRQAARSQSWLLDAQRNLQSRLAVAVREMKKGNGWLGALTLIGVSFLYGLFHAAGPGHGKAVISSYVVANRTTARRGIILSFVSSLAQALSAIGLVAVLAIGMNAAGLQIRQAVHQFEIASAVLVILTGLWLLFAQLQRLLPMFRPAVAIAHLHSAPIQGHPYHEGHHANHHHEHHHGHAHGDDCGCGHIHMPRPDDLEGRWSLRHAAAVVLAVGIRRWASEKNFYSIFGMTLINANLRQDGLENIVEHCRRNPNSPFGDTGPAIDRLIAAGASRRDLCLLLRSVAYDAVFGTLYSLGDPGVDRDDVFMLFEELLMADPSEMEGRPGSAEKSGLN